MQDNSSKDELNLPIDKGWEQMRAQLDEVMPEQRRRRFAWWWFVLLWLIGFGVSYAWSQLSNVPKKPEVPFSTPLVKEEKAEKEPSSTIAPGTHYGDEENLTSTHSEGVGDGALVATHSYVDGHHSPYEDVEITPDLVELGPQTYTTSAVVDFGTSDANTLNELADTEEASLTHDAGEVHFIGKRNAVYAGETRSLLTTLPIKLLSTTVSSVSLMPVRGARRPRKLHWYVEGLVGQTLNDAHSSLIFGLGAERSVGPAWTISAGLQFQQSQSLLFEDQSGVAFSDLSEPESGLSSVWNSSYDIRAAYQNLQTRRANTYLRGAYRINPRIDLGFGVQGSYFITASANISDERAFNPILFDDLNGSGLRVDLYDDQVTAVSHDELSNTADSAPLEVERWQWSAQMALTYRLHPAWSLELQYLRHLTAWPAKGEEFRGPHNLQLGVRYYFRH